MGKANRIERKQKGNPKSTGGEIAIQESRTSRVPVRIHEQEKADAAKERLQEARQRILQFLVEAELTEQVEGNEDKAVTILSVKGLRVVVSKRIKQALRRANIEDPATVFNGRWVPEHNRLVLNDDDFSTENKERTAVLNMPDQQRLDMVDRIVSGLLVRHQAAQQNAQRV